MKKLLDVSGFLDGLRFEIKALTPRIFAVHLDTEDGQHCQGDFSYGFDECRRLVLEIFNEQYEIALKNAPEVEDVNLKKSEPIKELDMHLPNPNK